jgi:hypothetical protein
LEDKKETAPKKFCSQFYAIDSISMFKCKKSLALTMSSEDRVCFTILQNNVTARLMDDYSVNISYEGGTYIIPVEKKSCNYGGFYYFFHCPRCEKRMRKLYCIQGLFLCRKCADLSYYSQWLSPSIRCLYMKRKICELLKNQAGGLDRKPPWKKRYTLHKVRKKYLDYDEKYFYAKQQELIDLYGSGIREVIDTEYSFFVLDGFYDVYDYNKLIS